MARLGWFVLQIAIVAIFIAGEYEDAGRTGRPISLGPALVAGIMFAFVATLAIVIVREQWLLWSRRWRDRQARALKPESREPARQAERFPAPHGGLGERAEDAPRLGLRE